MLTLLKRVQINNGIRLLTIVFLSTLLIGCGFDDSSKSTRLSDASSTNSDKRWGGNSKNDFMSNAFRQKELIKKVQELGYRGRENEALSYWAECVYDKETAYLEKTFGNSVYDSKINYRMDRISNETTIVFFDECFDEIRQKVKK